MTLRSDERIRRNYGGTDPVMADERATDARLRELAIAGAKAEHDWHFTLKAQYAGTEGHEEPLSTCPHPDCQLVRAASSVPATPESDWKQLAEASSAAHRSIAEKAVVLRDTIEDFTDEDSFAAPIVEAATRALAAYDASNYENSEYVRRVVSYTPPTLLHLTEATDARLRDEVLADLDSRIFYAETALRALLTRRACFAIRGLVGPQSGWRPIETAPEATYVWVWANAGMFRALKTTHPSDLGGPVWWTGEERLFNPTHWMPLPDPPVVSPTPPGDKP